MGEAPEALALGANQIREYFAEVNPNDGALRECERSDKSDQQPEQQFRALAGCENHGDPSQADRRSYRPRQQQLLAPQPIDHAHREEREHKVGEADYNCLHIARNLTESGTLENVVEIVQNRVDSRELVEDADGDCEEDGLAVTRLE